MKHKIGERAAVKEFVMSCIQMALAGDWEGTFVEVEHDFLDYAPDGVECYNNDANEIEIAFGDIIYKIKFVKVKR